MEKACRSCERVKSLGEFHSGSGKYGKHNQCKACRKIAAAAAYKENPQIRARNEAWREQNREARNALDRTNTAIQSERWRRRVLDMYGGRCSCCGEAEPRFLTVDHVDGVPDRHRWRSGRRISGLPLYRLIVSEGVREDIRVLCFNCNCGRQHNGGVCPHEQARLELVA